MSKVVNRVVHIPKPQEKNQLIDEIIKIRQIINDVAGRNDSNFVVDVASMPESPVISVHQYESIEDHEELLNKVYENKDFLTQRWDLVDMLREGRQKMGEIKPALSVNITGDFDLVFMRLPLRSMSEFKFFLDDVPKISKMGEIALSHNRQIANLIHY